MGVVAEGKRAELRGEIAGILYLHSPQRGWRPNRGTAHTGRRRPDLFYKRVKRNYIRHLRTPTFHGNESEKAFRFSRESHSLPISSHRRKRAERDVWPHLTMCGHIQQVANHSSRIRHLQTPTFHGNESEKSLPFSVVNLTPCLSAAIIENALNAMCGHIQRVANHSSRGYSSQCAMPHRTDRMVVTDSVAFSSLSVECRSKGRLNESFEGCTTLCYPVITGAFTAFQNYTSHHSYQACSSRDITQSPHRFSGLRIRHRTSARKPGEYKPRTLSNCARVPADGCLSPLLGRKLRGVMLVWGRGGCGYLRSNSRSIQSLRFFPPLRRGLPLRLLLSPVAFDPRARPTFRFWVGRFQCRRRMILPIYFLLTSFRRKRVRCSIP